MPGRRRQRVGCLNGSYYVYYEPLPVNYGSLDPLSPRLSLLSLPQCEIHSFFGLYSGDLFMNVSPTKSQKYRKPQGS